MKVFAIGKIVAAIAAITGVGVDLGFRLLPKECVIPFK